MSIRCSIASFHQLNYSLQILDMLGKHNNKILICWVIYDLLDTLTT